MKKRLYALTAALLAIAMLPSIALAAGIKAIANPATLATEGAATISITVTNDGIYPMENITISDPYQLYFDTYGVVVNPGEAKTFSVSTVIPEALLNQALGFDLAWTENGEVRTGSASVTILRGSTTGVTVTRTASTTSASPGETVVVKYKVVNSGTVTLKKVSLSDSEIAGKTPVFKDISLAPGEAYEFPYTFEMGYETLKSAPVVTYTPEGQSAPQTSEAIAVLQIGMVNTKLSIEVEQGAGSAEGVTFILRITNTGNQKLRGIKVKDELNNSVSGESFQLAVGEGRQITYKVQTEEERYVSFSVSATTDSGQSYEDKTKSYIVRKFIDPSLLGVEFKAEVLETLNAAGSIKVKFTFTNTGELEMKDLVLSEQTAGPLYQLEAFPKGEKATEQTIYVGEPRDLIFTLSLADPAGTPYSYTANIGASFLGDGFLATGVTPEPVEEPAEALGESIGSSVRTALKTALIVLGALTLAAGVALIVLSVLERKERERIARAKRRRERLLREQQASAGSFRGDVENTQVNRRPPADPDLR
ncbi:MAG: hypothetical protein ABFC62_05095 [Clostridiaceae bacterium]|nr:hypothetical protein [Eubacteriales bacterium]